MFISRIAGDGRRQRTADHLRESSEYAAALGKKFDISEMSRLATLLHDIGKFSQEFVNYLEESFKKEQAGEKNDGRGSVVHSTQGAKYIYEYKNLSQDLLGALVAEICALCIASHHGGLMDIISPEGDTPFFDRISKKSPSLNYEEVIQVAGKELNIEKEFVEIFQKARKELENFIQKCQDNRLNVAFMVHLLTKCVYSCLVDSDRYNAYCFDVKKEPASNFDGSIWEICARKLEEKIASFPKDSEINRIRNIISENCFQAASRPKGIYRLCVPTGGGKTLSSLRFALNHAKVNQADHVIYVIPFLSVIEQTAKEIKRALQYTDNDDYIIEHHSNFVIEDDKEKAQNYKLLTDRWDAPIIITTMVQFLESIYSEKAGDLRKLHNMANSVIIFDEVQSLPLKCTYLFNEAINFLHYFGRCTVLLCTATQPPLEEANKPLFLSEKPSLIPDMSENFKKLKRTRLVDKTTPNGYTIEELRDFVIEVYQREKNCLVIMNTRGDAKKLYASLANYFKENPTDAELLHLSTLMYPKHRLNVIEYIKKRNQKNIICISTQLIEAGVDISFGVVIRVVAGLDSIIQAAGRCNRHGEAPLGKDVYIVNLRGENLQNLPEIKAGADVTYNILESKPSDLMDEPIIQNYYRFYYHRNKFEMGYQTSFGSLYELLSRNIKGCTNLVNYGKKYKPALTQAFKTAGELFSVIDKRGTGVVVLNEESRKLISKYQSANFDEKKILLRKLGEYTVTLYPYQLEELKGYRALKLLNDEIYILDSSFYDDNLGVVFDINYGPLIA